MNEHSPSTAPFVALLAVAVAGPLLVIPFAGASVTKPARAVPFTVRLEDQILAKTSLPSAHLRLDEGNQRYHHDDVDDHNDDPTSDHADNRRRFNTNDHHDVGASDHHDHVGQSHPDPKRFIRLALPVMPTAVQRLWSVGTNNVVLTGALMRFQNVHGLPRPVR